MNGLHRSLLWSTFAVASVTCLGNPVSVAEGVKTSEIPLDQIWALDMPGTRDINELFQDDPVEDDKDKLRANRARQKLLTGISRMLASKRRGKRSMASFAVVADGNRHEVALARDGIRKGLPFFGEPANFRRSTPLNYNSFFTTDKLSIVFFSYTSPYFIEFERIERRGAVIDIRYRFVPGIPPGSSVHFALIPVGKLPVGEYRARISQSPMDQKYLGAGFGPVSDEQASRFVCQSFSFNVSNPPAPPPELTKDATDIPLAEIWAHMMPGTKKIHGLQKDVPDENTVMAKIGRVLSEKIRQKTEPSFAVEKTGLEGLKNAYAVFSGEMKRPTSLSKDNEISIVFFTHPSNYYVHLSRVVLDGNTIRVGYRLVPHMTQDMTMHFALIPIGKLPKGKYKVYVLAEPIEKKLLIGGLKEPDVQKKATIASSSFEFNVL